MLSFSKLSFVRSCVLYKAFLIQLFFISTVFANQDAHFLPISPDVSGELFVISGSNTVGAELAPIWVKQYLIGKGLRSVEVKNAAIANELQVVGLNGKDSVYVTIKAHGSSTGFQGLLNRTTDVAMSSRRIRPEENRAIDTEERMDSFDVEHVVAIDGIAIIVNPSNPVSELSIQEVAKVFSGEINNWSQLGGVDKPISLYARDENSGTWETFKKLIFSGNNKLPNDLGRYESNQELSRSVKNDPYAIGFVGLASVNESKVLAISDVYTQPLLPSHVMVATEDYPLSRRLFMYEMPNHDNAYVNEYLDFVLSNDGQGLVSSAGFVSQKPLSILAADYVSEEAPKPYRDLIENGERLSINFRFQEGSSSLDNKAKRDIERLVQYMKVPENGNKKIQLVGFGDLKKSSGRSVVLSKFRALTVKYELKKFGITTEPVAGFGAHLPVASNSSGNKTKNQRVEVWLFGDNEGDNVSRGAAKSYQNTLELDNTKRLVSFN